jgi:hypothetical protein
MGGEGNYTEADLNESNKAWKSSGSGASNSRGIFSPGSVIFSRQACSIRCSRETDEHIEGGKWIHEGNGGMPQM